MILLSHNSAYTNPLQYTFALSLPKVLSAISPKNCSVRIGSC
ncbi:MAG TPA: hypothetical protein PLA12_00380 [Candidatus Hydrogenedens sp.]|nr:hypothetical protein [Candidatus Hydrogenedens sp.]